MRNMLAAFCIVVNLSAMGLLIWSIFRERQSDNRMVLAQDEFGVIVPEGMTAQFQGYDGKTKEWVNLSPRIFNAKYRIVFEKEPKAVEDMHK